MQVLLPMRPNGSTGWIRSADVTLSTNAFRMDIALAEHRLVVHDGDQVVVDVPVGVGTAVDPDARGPVLRQGAAAAA